MREMLTQIHSVRVLLSVPSELINHERENLRTQPLQGLELGRASIHIRTITSLRDGVNAQRVESEGLRTSPTSVLGTHFAMPSTSARKLPASGKASRIAKYNVLAESIASWPTGEIWSSIPGTHDGRKLKIAVRYPFSRRFAYTAAIPW